MTEIEKDIDKLVTDIPISWNNTRDALARLIIELKRLQEFESSICERCKNNGCHIATEE